MSRHGVLVDWATEAAFPGLNPASVTTIKLYHIEIE